MSVVIISGSAGLIGAEAARHFVAQGLDVVGIDKDMRREFFGAGASTTDSRLRLERDLGSRYTHVASDIRDADAMMATFSRHAGAITAVIHAAAQPSHDWAARDPGTDFGVNAVGTLAMLEAARRHAPTSPFGFTSTNKVYGDRPDALPLVEGDTRWEIDSAHTYAGGIREDMRIDQCLTVRALCPLEIRSCPTTPPVSGFRIRRSAPGG